MTLILGFSPFILFAVLSRLSADLALWAAFAAAFVVTIRDFVESPSLRLLDIGNLTLFGVLALLRGFIAPGLSLLARAWRDRDHRGLTVVDVACGSGAFLADLRGAFPRASITGLDLSLAYLNEARGRSGAAVVQAAAERLPFADNSLDALTCVYLFHELPPSVRPRVAAEMARVLKPDGVLAFADSVQKTDEPELARLLEAFPAFFHEPYYDSYQDEDLEGLFAAAGLRAEGRDKAFLTKALLLRKD